MVNGLSDMLIKSQAIAGTADALPIEFGLAVHQDPHSLIVFPSLLARTLFVRLFIRKRRNQFPR